MRGLGKYIQVTLVLTWENGAESRVLVSHTAEDIVEAIDEAVNDGELRLTSVRLLPATREEWGSLVK